MNDNSLAQRCTDLLSARGSFSGRVSGFRERPQQQAMTAEVAAAIAQDRNLVVEVGTGIGKTFAYLVPVLLSGRRTIISTGTRHLQDQIHSKDLPVVLRVLGVKADVALLKGRANYLCLERMERLGETRLFDDDAERGIETVRRWSRSTPDGDLSAMPDVVEDYSTRQLLTSTAENCLGSSCRHYRSCFVVKARQRAVEADVVVVNHHLLMADMALKEEGFGELLPGTELIVVDEAHQLKGIAESNFAESFISRRLVDLLNDVAAAVAEEGVDDSSMDQAADASRQSLDAFTALFARLPERGAIQALRARSGFDDGRRALSEALVRLAARLKTLRVRSEQLSNCWQRAETMKECFDGIMQENSEAVAWFRHGARSFQLHLSPLDVAPLLAEKTKLYDANWIYTSATISVGGDFSHFLSAHGLDAETACASFDSPFDYPSQAALYLPQGLPDPNHENYTADLVRAACPLLELSHGRAFFLFTSYRALHEAAAILGRKTAYRLLVQGDAPKLELIRRFRERDGSVLLGTSSFWEGVDVKGAALSCIIIDRLPFASPGDPLMQAKMLQAKKQERNFFMEATLPEAVIGLRQGVGRLIRDECDTGVVMIGDGRLRTKSYGRVFLKSLPPMKVFKGIAPLRSYFQ